MLFVLVRFHPFDTHRRLLGRQNLSLGISSIRLTCGKICGTLWKTRLVWEGPARCGQCPSWAAGPALHKEVGWESQGEQDSQLGLFLVLLQSLPPGSCFSAYPDPLNDRL